MIEKRSWIVLFIILQLLFLLIAYIDPSIPIHSVLYIVFLSWIIFITFFIFRYHKETNFYKNIQQSDDMYDLTYIDFAKTPFEKIVKDRITRQTEQYKFDIAKYQFDLEQEKDDLLAWIHEVKTPLTTMQLMIERIKDDTLKAQMMYEWLRIDLLLDQQLHQKRIPFIENDLHIEQVPLQQVIHTEIKSLQSWCIQKGIGFELTLQVKEVLSDTKWLGFIIRQLLTNAIKYSSESDIIIKSYTKGNQTRVEVVDYGRGIDVKDLPRIFEKGFTSTTKHRSHAATGMGLFLVKKVADSLMIHIDVQSKRYEGTTFILSFPAKNEYVHLTSM